MALPVFAALFQAFTKSLGSTLSSTLGSELKKHAGKKQMTMKVRLDTREFDAKLRRYMQYSKKTMPEIINTKAYYVARNAVNLTKAVDPQNVEGQLLQSSRVASSAPLAAILVNAKKGAQGADGLHGKKMQSAVNKLIRARKRSVNFLRSGWIPAIKAMERFVTKKSGPAYKRVKTFGSPKGGGKGARANSSFRSSAEIWNEVTGGKDRGLETKGSPTKVANILQRGLQAALNKEIASMDAYIQKKVDEDLRKAGLK